MQETKDLQDQLVVITGKLMLGTRADLERFIEDSGGIPKSSVTAKTNLVIYGEKAGSKLTSAQGLGVETISELEFYKLFGFVEPPPPSTKTLDLKGLTVVITGKLMLGTRTEIKQFITDSGGKRGSTIGKKTDLVIYGERAGENLAKARELGVKVISEADFYRRCGFT